MNIVALIPARGGSKGIPRKNIIDYRGMPMLAHSILLAKSCKFIDRVIVDTDDEEIAQIAKNYGAEIPYIRPSNLAQDLSNDLCVFEHFISKINADVIVHLRPTYPERTIELLDNCIRTFFDKYDSIDSLRTVVMCDKSPYKMYTIDNQGCLCPLFETLTTQNEIIYEPYNEPRQRLPTVYLHNGCIDIIKTETIKSGSMSGKRIFSYIMNECKDIDTPEDLRKSLK